MRIGYLGPKGTFTHFACEQAVIDDTFSDSEIIEFQSLDRLFDALHSKTVDYIFSPIENSIEGPVNRVLDGLIHVENARIEKVFTMPINQSILCLKEDLKLENIQHIVSMPHAIAQCYRFIKKYCPTATLHHAPSTAGSVPMIDALKLPKETTVVIGHQGISRFFPSTLLKKTFKIRKKMQLSFALLDVLKTIFLMIWI